MARSAVVLVLGALALTAPAAPASAAGLGSLFSCDAPGSANTTGAVVGGLIGALAGSQISRNERTLGAAIGAGLGAAIGNGVGCRMDRKSRQDAQQAFERALETGRAQSWSDPQTGASGRIEVLDRVEAPVAAPRPAGRWRFAEGVTPALRVSDASRTYAANGRINMRAAPSASAPVIDRLQADETFEVAGLVAGGWLAVEEAGRIQGYVARSVARPAAAGLDDADCRRVRQTLVEPGQPTVREQYTACRGADGTWNLNTV